MIANISAHRCLIFPRGFGLLTRLSAHTCKYVVKLEKVVVVLGEMAMFNAFDMLAKDLAVSRSHLEEETCSDLGETEEFGATTFAVSRLGPLLALR